MKKCKVCESEYPATAEYFYSEKRTKDGLRAKCKTCFLDENKGKKRKRDRKEYVEQNKETLKLAWKEYKEKNKDKISKQKQKYYKMNKGKLIESIREYQKENKDKILLRNGIYKRIRYTDEVRNYTIEEWEKCKSHFNYKCAYCGCKKKLTKEHFIPFKSGGEYSSKNIIPVCKSCNSSKYDKSFFDWYPLQDFYSTKREEIILDYLKYDINSKTQQLSIL